MTYRLFDGVTPEIASGNDDASTYTLGTKFKAGVEGDITAIRWYRTPDTSQTAYEVGLWTAAGTLLASATVTGISGLGWQEAPLDPPVAIDADTVYVAGVLTYGYYPYTNHFFSSADFVHGPLTGIQSTTPFGAGNGNGVFLAYSGLDFPTSSYNSTNYFVDVTFKTGGGAETTIAGAVGAGAASGHAVVVTTATVVHTAVANAAAGGHTAAIIVPTVLATGVGAASASGHTAAIIVADGAQVSAGIGDAAAAGHAAVIEPHTSVGAGVAAAIAQGAQAIIVTVDGIATHLGTAAAAGHPASIVTSAAGQREIWRASSHITTAVHASSHITAQVLRTSTIYLQDDT